MRSPLGIHFDSPHIFGVRLIALPQALASETNPSWNWPGLKSMDDLCHFTHDIPKAHFPKKGSKVIDFVSWLEQNQKVRMTCDLHMMVKKGKVWSIKPDKQFVYKVLNLDESHKEKPSDQNAGSLLKVGLRATNATPCICMAHGS